MKKTDNGFVTQVDFKKQTHEVLIGAVKPNTLYEKAFLSREDNNNTEFALNTTTWD